MELLPASTRKVLPPFYDQEKSEDPIVYLKLFTPDSNWTWYVTEGSEEDARKVLPPLYGQEKSEDPTCGK